MSRVCSICNKGKMSGNTVSHSHRRAKASWGVNVQKVKVINKGVQTSQYVCTRCLRSGKVDRA